MYLLDVALLGRGANGMGTVNSSDEDFIAGACNVDEGVIDAEGHCVGRLSLRDRLAIKKKV